MARRSTFMRILTQHQREVDRSARVNARNKGRALREAERNRRSSERVLKTFERERSRQYIESREATTISMNTDLENSLHELTTLLQSALIKSSRIDFESLKSKPKTPSFLPGALAEEEPHVNRKQFAVPPLSVLMRLIPGAKRKHELAADDAKRRFALAVQHRDARERDREARLVVAKAAHESAAAAELAKSKELNAKVDEFQATFEAGDPHAVVEYFSLVLDSSVYPVDFPSHFRIAYVPESKQLVVEYELPTVDVIPDVKQFRYVKARDVIDESPRATTQIRSLYSQIICQLTLRTLHEIFESDSAEVIETVVLNGFVPTIDPATGQSVKPHLVTVRTAKKSFAALQLASVDPVACLKGLNAAVSRSPTELLPVRPIVEFNMVDARFVQESDVLGTLDKRPNLMELSPKDFESLITNLFTKMGLETRQTQASRDGGVDCVAWDSRPIFGGKVIIQAKRYKHTVGVSAVRDLYGTTQNEGASKGILVTTSGYGSASFKFAENKPLELLSGTHLLYLLAHHAGIEARIEAPEEWVDPIGDIASDELPETGPPVPST